jgi:hypothetical protein
MISCAYYINEHIELAWWPNGTIRVVNVSDSKVYKRLFTFSMVEGSGRRVRILSTVTLLSNYCQTPTASDQIT